MTREADDLTRALDLLWLRSELAALPAAGAAEDIPVAGLRSFARRALLRAQTEGEDAPTNAELDRLIVLLMIDRVWRAGGKMVQEMDSARFQVVLDAHTDRFCPFAVRFDVTRPGATRDGATRDGDKGPAR